MKVWYQAEADSCRESVRVSDLRAWCDKTGAVLPATTPSLDAYEAVHIESLLLAIQRHEPEFTDRGVIELARTMKCHPKELQMIVDDGDVTVARRVIGSSISAAWESSIRLAIERGELRCSDALTGMPIAIGSNGATPSPKGVPQQRAQEDAVLNFLKSKGIDPLNMPKAPAGNKPWPLRADTMAELNMSKAVTIKTFERLRSDGRMSKP